MKKKTNEILTERYIGSGRMSFPERMFQNEGYLLLRETLPPEVFIETMGYEWITFNLPGGRYTPDFMILCSDKNLILVEVKQEHISKRSGRAFRGQSYRDSRSKLRAAASINPWWKFYMAIYTDGGWRLEYIQPVEFIYPDSMKGDNDARTIDES